MNKRGSFIPDLFITIPTVLLISLGILVIFSSEPKLAIQQLVIAIIGLALYWFFSFIDLKFYKDYLKYIYVFILLLLVVVFILGFETRGSIRWIPLGLFNFQPSEFVKPIIILLLAKFWSENNPTWLNMGKSALIVFPAAILIFRQPDLGTTLTISMIWLFMLIGSNISILKLLVMFVTSLISAPLGWVFLKDYQKYRITSFLSPEKDPLGIGYNAIQSTIAVGSGEVFGRGLGRGTQSRLQFLPEFRTDFIFASIAEEFGFLGSSILLLLYSIIIGRSIRIMFYANSRFNNLVVLGVLGMFFFQIIVNMGMNIGILPITGITLPLLSYGGSSLLTTLICLGFIASVAKFGKKG
ncbi:MAG: rod shape-determining protein RodA [Candidatus Daviesbacteria bacterium]|nr:rod shape-determining protein RodA [Candidatus Daviesbacteria bacterium]